MATKHDKILTEIEELKAENVRLRSRLQQKNSYIRSKVNELLEVMGTKPLRPEELDEEMLLALDPLGIIFTSIRHVLTNLKETNSRLHLLHEETSAIFASADVGIMVVDSDLRIQSYNPRMQTLFFPDKNEEQIKNAHCFQLLCKKSGPPRAGCACRQVITSGETCQISGKRLHDYLFDVSASPIKASSGQMKHIVVVYHDITQLKKTQEELNRLNSDLELRVNERTAQLMETNKELDSFAYSVSHDLRAPLRGVDGFSAILEEEYCDILGDNGKEYLSRIRRGCVRMNELIDDILKLSRITRSEIRHRQVDLSRIAENVIAELQMEEPERQVIVSIEPDMRAIADPVLIRSVLENLLGNAWKFTRHTERPHIEFCCQEHNGERAFLVRDNGAGFDMQFAGNLFKAFQRLHRPEEFEGTGIGLASVQRIIFKHGGKVWAEGAEGQGATIFFTLEERQSSQSLSPDAVLTNSPVP